jgi:hypothetical protein
MRVYVIVQVIKLSFIQYRGLLLHLEVGKVLLEKVLLKESLPLEIQSDNAPEFIKGVVEQVNKLLGIHGISGNPWKPAVNGAVERKNRTIGTLLTLMCNKNKDNWVDKLPFIEYANDIHINPTIGMTPRFYITGFDNIDPFASQFVEGPKRKIEKKHFMEWKRDIEIARQWGSQHREIQQDKMKEQFDKKKPEHNFKEKDKVFVFWPKSDKLDAIWHGPYELEKFQQKEKRSAVLHHGKDKNDKISVHVDRLMKVEERPKDILEDTEWLDMTKDASRDISAEEEEYSKELEEEMNHDSQVEEERDYWDIEKIIDHYNVNAGKKNEYRRCKVRFTGFSPDYDLWYDEEDLLPTAGDKISEYMKETGLDMKQKSTRRRKRKTK